MPIAKQDLRDGFVLVAAKGTYVSNDVVAAHGWEDLVEPGEDPVAGRTDPTPEKADDTQAVPAATEMNLHRRRTA